MSERPAGAKRIGVVDEQDVFRRGVVAALADDPLLNVVVATSGECAVDGLDIAVVSSKVAATERFSCPLVVLVARDRHRPEPVAEGNVVAARLDRATLREEQLVATVRAAAVGLRVETQDADAAPAPGEMNERCRDVLHMLAEGADTQAIAESLSYSERTIKSLVREIQRQLRSRTRAQAVAEGIRRGLI